MFRVKIYFKDFLPVSAVLVPELKLNDESERVIKHNFLDYKL